MANQSDAFGFELVGFPGLPQMYNSLVASIFFSVYNMSLFSNVSVIALIMWKDHLHQPMYVIIANLALSDLLFDTITLPKIIAKYWFGAGSISFFECMFQMFWIHFLGTVDSFIIMMMAIDRYIAICKPLRYSSVVTNKYTSLVCSSLWFIATIIPIINSVWHALFPYCGSRRVNNCFCSSIEVRALACGNISLLSKTTFWLAMVVLMFPLAFIIFSYFIIIKTIHSSTASEGLQKAFYTCATHLFIISMYFGPRVFIYAANQAYLIFSPDNKILIICLYTFIPHVANPIIYCLRTKEIKQTIGKVLRIKQTKKQNMMCLK